MALETNIKVHNIIISDEDHIWVNGKQFISLTRVGRMLEEDREKRKATREPAIDVATLLYKAADAILEVCVNADNPYCANHCLNDPSRCRLEQKPGERGTRTRKTESS